MEEIRQNNSHLATTSVVTLVPENQAPTDYFLSKQVNDEQTRKLNSQHSRR
jgi:hypothetical protein